MTIKARFHLILFALILFTAAGGLVLMWNQYQLSEKTYRMRQAAEILNNVFMMRIVLEEYDDSQGDRPKQDWAILYARLGKLLQNLDYPPSFGEQYNNLVEKHAEMNGLFNRLVAANEGPHTSKSLLRGRLKQMLSNNLETMLNDGLALHELVSAQTVSSQRNGQLFVIIIIVSMLVLAGANLLVVKNAVLTPLGFLTDQARRIGGGDFDGPVMLHSRDELGYLASSFNQMSQNLKTSYVSLNAEIEQRIRVADELRRMNRTLSTLLACNDALLRAESEVTLFEKICRIAVEHGGFRMAWVGIAEEFPEKIVRPVSKWGYDEGYLDSLLIRWDDSEWSRGPSGQAIRTGKVCMTADVVEDKKMRPWSAEAAKRGYASSISLPLIVDERPFGTFTVYSHEPAAFNDTEIKLLERLAGNISYGIQSLSRKRMLELSEEKYRYLVEQAGSVIVRWTPDGSIAYMNDFGLRYFGYSEVELIGKPIVGTIVPPVDSSGENLSAKIEAIPLEPVAYSEMENENITKDGRKPWFFWTNKPVYDSNGKLVEFLAVGTDISRRKAAEDAIQKERAVSEAVIATLPGIFFIVDEDDNIMRWNTNLETFTRRSGEDIPDAKLGDLLKNGDNEGLYAALAEGFRVGSFSAQADISAAEETTTPFLFNGRRIRLDDKDRLAVTGIDITDLRAAEEQLARRNRRFEAILNATEDVVCLIAPDTTVITVNRAALLKLGKPQESLQGKPFAHMTAKNLVSTRTAHLNEVIETAAVRQFEDQSGKAYYFNTYYPVLDASNRVETVAAFSSDITPRKSLEIEREKLITELEAKSAELERFTYTVSHDLKSPLITIKSFLGFIEESAEEGNIDGVREDLDRVGNAADKMGRLLDELLELSRIGRIMNEPSTVPFDRLAHDTVELLSGRIRAQNIDVRIAPDLPVLYGDEPRLAQVVQNLLENAIKFMGDQPHPTINIGAVNLNGETALYVSDNGIGIDAAFQERIFRLFDKLDPETEGCGTGLALVKRIIEVHGGRIWAQSNGEGHGAVFYFTLPSRNTNV